MRKLTLLLLAWLLAATPALAQYQPPGWINPQPVTGTFWQATQPVSLLSLPAITGSVSVSNFPSTYTVTGTFWQATQPVSGTFWQATQPVSIASMPSTPVTGTFWQATQPVSGTFWQTTQPVSLAANQSVNVAQMNGATTSMGNGTTDTGTQRVTLSSDSTGLVKLAAGANTIGALTANQSVNTAQINGVTPLMGSGVMGTGAQRVVIASNNDALAVTGTFFQTTQPVSLAANQSVNVAQMNGVTTSMNNGTTDTGTQRVTLSSDSTGLVKLATGANTIGALTANQSVNIAQMNGVTTSMGNGTTDTGTQRVTLSSDSTGLVELATGANTIGALSANQSVNVAQINGVTPLMGSGVMGTGAQRVVIASNNDALAVTGTFFQATQPVSLSANQSVNVAQMNGVTTSMNNGTTDTGTQRVTLSSDSTGLVKLATGANTIGALTANQSVNTAQVNGVTVSTGTGVMGTGVQRVAIASDNDALAVKYSSGTFAASESSLDLAQASTTSGQKGPLIQGAVTTAAPSYTTAQTSPLSLDTAGNLRVNVVTGGAGGGAVTQSGTWAVEMLDSGGTNKASISAGGAVKVDGSAVVQPVSENAAVFASPTTMQNVANSITSGTALNVAGYASATCQFSAAAVGAGVIQFRASVDGINYVPVAAYNSNVVFTTPPTVPEYSCTYNTGSTNYETYRVDVAGYQFLKAYITTYTSGIITVTGYPSTVPISWLNGVQQVGVTALPTLVLGAGGNTIGALTANQSVNLAQVAGATTSNTNPLMVAECSATKATYAAASTSFTPPATPTDVFTLTGSGTKTIKILRILIDTSQTTFGTNTWSLIIRSAANTGGTSTNPTAVPLDSNNAAATATVNQYSVNPTGLGATVGTIMNANIASNVLASGVVYDYLVPLFDAHLTGQPIVLRGTTQVCTVSFGGATLPAGLTCHINIEWTEE